jgi:hypothetical protein
MTDVTPEAAEFMKALESDPDLSEAAVEMAVLVDLVKQNRIPEAGARIEGWDSETRGTVALFLACAVASQVPA